MDGRIEILPDSFQGKRLNSPNDLAVRSDGTIWFTDPAYGPVAGGKELDGNYVFRIDPRSGEVSIASKELTMPNGICLSPGEKTLYVGQGGAGRYIKRFKIHEDGTLAAGEVLCVIEGGVPDGLKCDRDGNLYVAGTGGVQIFAPDGQPVATIRVPPTAAERPRVTNLCFGGEGGKVLFITARSSLFRIGLKVAGHFPGASRQ